jgi:hypothetical protein
MFVRWQSRTRRTPGNGSYGLAFDRGDGVKLRFIENTKKLDVHHAANLIRSVRVDGKPRQEHVAYLGSFLESESSPFIHFWDRVESKLKALGKVISPTERRKIELELAKRVKRPTAAQRHKHHQEKTALIKAISKDLAAAPKR